MRVARPAAIDPFTVAQLVALPGFPDRKTSQQGQEDGDQR
jgi:hypothetical protein